jgi:hypothetical protein
LSNALELSNFGATCLESFRSVAAAIEFGGIPSRRSYACWSESPLRKQGLKPAAILIAF